MGPLIESLNVSKIKYQTKNKTKQEHCKSRPLHVSQTSMFTITIAMVKVAISFSVNERSCNNDCSNVQMNKTMYELLQGEKGYRWYKLFSEYCKEQGQIMLMNSTTFYYAAAFFIDGGFSLFI